MQIAFQLIQLLILKIVKMNLKDKKIIITGATGGIGNSLVEKFYNYGSSIVATGTNEEKLKILKKNIQTF